MPHLWEVDHPYYCEAGNYHSSDAATEWESWEAFIGSYRHADVDMNLVFRWDWHHQNPDDEGWGGGSWMFIGIMGQRKGAYWPHIIKNMKPEDEPEVREYLTRHLDTIKQLWAPLLEVD